MKTHIPKYLFILVDIPTFLNFEIPTSLVERHNLVSNGVSIKPNFSFFQSSKTSHPMQFFLVKHGVYFQLNSMSSIYLSKNFNQILKTQQSHKFINKMHDINQVNILTSRTRPYSRLGKTLVLNKNLNMPKLNARYNCEFQSFIPPPNLIEALSPMS